jgi:hypothetical protein
MSDVFVLRNQYECSRSAMTEDQLEQEALGWLTKLGNTHRYGPDIAHAGDEPLKRPWAVQTTEDDAR